MDVKQSVSMDTILMIHLECSAIDHMINVITPLIVQIEVMKEIVLERVQVERLNVSMGMTSLLILFSIGSISCHFIE